MKQEKKEIELQTYSISYTSPVSCPSLLSYHWDGECHLVINDNFYSHSPVNQQMDFAEVPDFEVEGSYDKMEGCLSDVQSSNNMEVSTGVSTDGAVSNFDAPIPSVTTNPHSLEDQLDFIMESSKKHTKTQAAEKKHRRNRKTPAQLDILTTELGSLQTVDKDKIREVASQTGLSEIQVYKWFWDRKAKTA